MTRGLEDALDVELEPVDWLLLALLAGTVLLAVFAIALVGPDVRRYLP